MRLILLMILNLNFFYCNFTWAASMASNTCLELFKNSSNASNSNVQNDKNSFDLPKSDEVNTKEHNKIIKKISYEQFIDLIKTVDEIFQGQNILLLQDAKKQRFEDLSYLKKLRFNFLLKSLNSDLSDKNILSIAETIYTMFNSVEKINFRDSRLVMTNNSAKMRIINFFNRELFKYGLLYKIKYQGTSISEKSEKQFHKIYWNLFNFPFPKFKINLSDSEMLMIIQKIENNALPENSWEELIISKIQNQQIQLAFNSTGTWLNRFLRLVLLSIPIYLNYQDYSIPKEPIVISTEAITTQISTYTKEQRELRRALIEDKLGRWHTRIINRYDYNQELPTLAELIKFTNEEFLQYLTEDKIKSIYDENPVNNISDLSKVREKLMDHCLLK